MQENPDGTFFIPLKDELSENINLYSAAGVEEDTDLQLPSYSISVSAQEFKIPLTPLSMESMNPGTPYTPG